MYETITKSLWQMKLQPNSNLDIEDMNIEYDMNE